jgi:hypothetical protein
MQSEKAVNSSKKGKEKNTIAENNTKNKSSEIEPGGESEGYREQESVQWVRIGAGEESLASVRIKTKAQDENQKLGKDPRTQIKHGGLRWLV